MVSKNNLKLVSFDSGGIRGLSQLEIMSQIMHRLGWNDESSESDERSLPCEHFDLIGGSGTGGLIAILLAKLRMSVEEASEEFYEIIKHVFLAKDISASERTESLRTCMENILKKKGIPVDILLTAKKQEGCASFVVASLRTNAKSIVYYRTYAVRSQRSSEITVVEAVLATCATPPELAPVSVGSGFKAREYIAASGAANPMYEVITEAHLLFGGDSTVTSLLSLGAGDPGITSLPKDGGEAALHNIMRDMAYDCERRAQEMEQRVGRVGIYLRFSVNQGMQSDHIGQFDDPSWIMAQTEDYLSHHETGERLDLLVRNLGIEKGPITLEQLKHVGGPSAPGYITSIVQKSLEILISNQDDETIAKLKPKDLEYESQAGTCLEGTRQDILEEIRIWTIDLEAPNILWITGYPGVGKSAIASTIVEELRSSDRLGSNFFFQRERARTMTPKALWCRVAYDLARRYSTIREHVVAALNANENLLTTPNVDILFSELISGTLTKSDDIPTEKLPVIVLDALDECGGIDGWRSDHRKNLIPTLKSWSELPGRFKLVVTSRRESDIEQLFSTTMHHPIEIFAGEKVNSTSSADIRAFLVHELRRLLAARYPSLPLDWPGEEAILWLINRAGGLFIWIKTIIKLLERGEPQRTLRQILRQGAGGMVDLYTWILHASFPKPTEDDTKDFNAVMGTIIFTREPLDVANLAHFLSVDRSTIEYILGGLQSVLDYGSTVRIRHQSFVDFLLDPKSCPPSFLFNVGREARNLTLYCFHTMKHYLRFNICDLESSYVRNRDVPNLAQRVDECIPPYLSYSSRYWASHLIETTYDDEINDSLEYFMGHQYLFWLEVMSLIKEVNIGSDMLQSLVNWVQKLNLDDLLATDMQKFLAAFAGVISQSTPHIYISALPFAPQCLSISKQYIRCYPQTLVVKSGGYDSWPSIQNVFAGHDGSVLSAVFSPDGRRIVSGSSDHMVRVWDIRMGETVVGPLRGHTGSVRSVSFSPDGRKIISGSDDCTIRVWDAETGETVLGPMGGHSDWVSSVSFSPDGGRFVSSSSDHTIRIWNAETSKMVTGPLQGPSDWVCSVSFSPNGQKIVSGSSDHTIRVWGAEVGEMVMGPLQGHDDWVWSVSFSPDGRRIVSGSADRTIRVWDVETGETVVGPLQGHGGPVYSVLFSPDGRKIASGSKDKSIRIWDAETGKTALGPLHGHSDSVWSVSFSSDGRRIVSASSDHIVRVWDAEMGETVNASGPYYAPVQNLLWAPGRSVLPSFAQRRYNMSSGMIQVWDIATGETVLGPLKYHGDLVCAVSFSPDGGRIVAGSEDSTIRVWDAETGETAVDPLRSYGGRVISSLEGGRVQIWDAGMRERVLSPLGSYSNSVLSTTFSPDGRRVAFGFYGHTIRICDTEAGETVLGPLHGHAGSVRAISFSPDGRKIVSGSDDCQVRVWDAKTGETVLGPLKHHNHSVCFVSFSPDGRRIVASCEGYYSRIRVWDAETGETVGVPLQGDIDPVLPMSFSPDGRRIVSSSSENTIRVWNVETGAMVIGPLQGHTSSLRFFCFSPNGRQFASGSGDCTIQVWDTETGDMIMPPLQGHTERVRSISFSADGRRIVSHSYGDTIRVWDVETSKTMTGPSQGYNTSVRSPLFPPKERQVVFRSNGGATHLHDHQSNNGRLSWLDPYSSFRENVQTQNGWVLGPNEELLFWVPPEIRHRLSPLRCMLVIDKRQVWTNLDLTHFVHGKEWSRCKDSPITRMLQDPC